MVQHVGGVPVAEIIDVLEAASNALLDAGHSHTGGMVDRLITRLKESSDG